MELKIQDVNKKFKDIWAIQNLTVIFQPGIYGLLGANGAGKTTLMKMLATLLYPSSGSIQYNGEDIYAMKEAYRDLLGYLPQKFGYYPDFSGYDFMMYLASLKGFNHKEAKLRVLELLEFVHLSDVKNKKLSTYSGGMIQRLGIAQALINDPSILILDEPTAGLDPKERIHFRNIIANLSRNRMILLSTHIVSDIESIANELLFMKKGSILYQGSVEKILQEVSVFVYEVPITLDQIAIVQENYCIGNIRNESSYAWMRIVTTQTPQWKKYQVNTTLEDVYLYLYREEMRKWKCE